MAKKLIVNMGFITNSSSAIHWFDKTILTEPEVVHFLQTYGLDSGFVGSDLWNRSRCETVALTKDQKHELKAALSEPEYGASIGNSVNPDDDTIVLVYGDEYQSVVSELASILSEVADRKNYRHSQDDFN